MVICLQRGADLHIAQLMPLPLIVSCFSKIQIGFAFLLLAHPGSPRKRAIKRVCVCVCVRARVRACVGQFGVFVYLVLRCLLGCWYKTTLRRHCFSHRTLYHSVWLCDRL